MGVLGVERRGSVAVLRLHRPDRRNALDGALVDELDAALTAAEDDPAVHAAVLTGSPPGFCAGSDLRELAGLSRAGMVRHEERTGLVARRLQWLPMPVVAAVEGFAIGGGFFLAASCDVVVSAGDARWHLPEVPLGWIPPWGLQALVARVGPVVARRLVWGADPPPVRELHRLGAVDEVAPPGAAEAYALDLATRLAALPPHAVAATKRALADAAAGPGEALDARAARQFGDDSGTPAARATLERYR